MSKNSVYGVILAGGRGERFWPLSTVQRPKQFLRLISDKMMLEETIDRVLPIIPKENTRIVTSESMAELISKSVKGVKAENMVDDLLYNKDVFIAPGSIFGSRGEGYIRFSLCVPEEKIKEALERL